VRWHHKVLMICDLLSESQGGRPGLSNSRPVQPADKPAADGLNENKVSDAAVNVPVVGEAHLRAFFNCLRWP